MKIVSVIIISIVGWLATGYDLFTVLTLASLSIDLYKGLHKLQKKYYKVLMMKRKIRK